MKCLFCEKEISNFALQDQCKCPIEKQMASIEIKMDSTNPSREEA